MLSSWRARLRLPSFSCALASRTDRKSTRLNSSHSQISYAVFCLKKKSELHKHYRLAAGLSQEALAARASLSARTISDLQRGIHSTPHTATFEVLTVALYLPAHPC